MNSNNLYERYHRQIILPEFGEEGQQKLLKAKVLVIGAGGLGCPALQYLTAAGIGTIGIVDFDVVEESNLQRQVIFDINDIGKPKAEAAQKKLQALNPYIQVNIHPVRLTSANAMDLLREYDVIADGSDNFPTRYLVNDACVLLNKPLVYGSILQFEGQISVFNCLKKEGGRNPNYRDLYPTPPRPGEIPDCAEAGVLGVLPGIIGSMQAAEVIKLITHIGEPLAGKLFLFNALDFSTRILNFKPDENNPLTGKYPTIKELINYTDFCNFEPTKPNNRMKEITPAELKTKMDNKDDFQLIDVREDYEYDIANLGGELIPLGNILQETARISKDKMVVIHCKAGGRSGTAIIELEKRFGFTNLYNLKGGILAYSKEVDASIPTY